MLLNKKIKSLVTIGIGDVCGIPESSNNYYAHNHQEPVDDRNIDLTHEFPGCMDNLNPGKATKGHGLLYAGKCC